MDCRTFHRKLEGYLEGGMDFSARFGMERHAKQCLACEKDIRQAMKLRRLAQGLERVAAPQNFEAALLERIRLASPRNRSGVLRSLWIYGFEGFRWRAAGVTALVTVCVVGGLYYLHFGRDLGRGAALQASLNSPSSQQDARDLASTSNEQGSTVNGLAEIDPAGGVRSPGPTGQNVFATPFSQVSDSDFIEVSVPGPDGRQLIMRLPKTIRMEYGRPTRDYYLRYVSH